MRLEFNIFYATLKKNLKNKRNFGMLKLITKSLFFSSLFNPMNTPNDLQEKTISTTLSIENYNDAKPIAIAHDYETVPSSLTPVTENKFDVALLKNAVREGESIDTINLLIEKRINLEKLEASDIFPRDGENNINRGKIIKLLLKNGLNPNVILKKLYSSAHISNYGPIIFYDIEIVRLLLPSIKTETDFSMFGGISSLIWSIGSHKSDIYSVSENAVDLFLETIKYNTNYPFTNYYDTQALYAAANANKRNIVSLFIKAGINPGFFNSPSRMVSLEGRRLIISVLEEHECEKYKVISRKCTSR